jgi:ATP-dependent helicase HrpA
MWPIPATAFHPRNCRACSTFIKDELMRGDFDCQAAIFRDNRELIDELENMEAIQRRRDIIVDVQVLYDFYDERLLADIHSGRVLELWLRKHKGEDERLRLKRDDLIRDEATLVSKTDFPKVLNLDDSRFSIEYHFYPQHHCDGITLITPLSALNAIDAQRCEWLLPGLLHENKVAPVRSLPKPIRRNLVPAPYFAEACVQAMQVSNTGLTAALAAELNRMTGFEIPYDAWYLGAIPIHLLVNFRVLSKDFIIVG